MFKHQVIQSFKINLEYKLTTHTKTNKPSKHHQSPEIKEFIKEEIKRKDRGKDKTTKQS